MSINISPIQRNPYQLEQITSTSIFPCTSNTAATSAGIQKLGFPKKSPANEVNIQVICDDDDSWQMKDSLKNGA